MEWKIDVQSILSNADYHRFHAPFDATLGEQYDIQGAYYTGTWPFHVTVFVRLLTFSYPSVNPVAVKENLDVFTANRRAVQIMYANVTPSAPTQTTPFAFIAVGAMLVGGIGWSQDPGSTITKGDDFGWFQYGGSTTIIVAPQGSVSWDADLLANSKMGVETLVRVGDHIGRAMPGVQVLGGDAGDAARAA